MPRKAKKIICIILTLILFIMFASNIVYANGLVNFNTFDNKGNSKADNAAKTIAGTAVNVIQIVGTGVSIIAIVLVAIKYMSAAPSERAEFKKSATIYVIGAILTFGSVQVLGLIEDFVNNNLK